MEPETDENTPTMEERSKRPYANIFLGLAVVLCAFGIYKMYFFTSDDKIVGGDAYNYIIWAARATAWICAGIISALIGVAISIYDLTDQRNS